MTKKTIKHYQSKHVLIKSDIPAEFDDDMNLIDGTGVVYEIDGVLKAKWVLDQKFDDSILKNDSSTHGNIPTWDGTTGDRLADGYGVEVELVGNPTNIPRADAVKTYIDTLLSANDAMLFKGTLGIGGTFSTLPTTYSTGWTLKVITAGTYAGKVAEVGDMYVALVNRNGTNNNNSDWTVIQTNIDGAVTGPASSIDNHIAVFNGSTGKLIKSSGTALGNGTLSLSTSGIASGSQTFSANQSSNASFTVNVPGTDLGEISRTANNVTISSSTGNNVVLSPATVQHAGLMTSDDKAALLGIETEISKSVPPGSLGQLPFIKIEGTRETEQDYILKVGQFVITESELDEAKQNIVSNQEIFNTWYRYSHNSSENQPANAGELNGWAYNAVTDRISSTINSATHIGFVSTKRYSSYTHEVKFWSTNNDDDDIGILLAFDVDPVTGREFTLTAIRSPGGTNAGTWSIWYNYLRNDQWKIIDGNSTVAWGNGEFGATRAAAGYVVNSAGNGWVNATRSTRILAVRQDDVFTMTTTQLGSDTLDANTTVTFSLNSDPRLTRFRGPKSYGYMAFSQAASTYQVISFSDTANIIYDLRTDDVYVYDSLSTVWVIDAAKSLYTDIGYGRFIHNPNTKRMFFINRDDSVTEVVPPLGDMDDIYLRLTGGTINGNLTVNGNIMAQTYDSSSMRVKDDIIDVKNEDDVLLLCPKYYFHKAKGRYEYGLIAEDVVAVYPEIVLNDNEGNPVGVDYSKLVVMLLAKIKSMDTEIKRFLDK